MSKEPEIKYVAEVEPVREVSLVGVADLAFWSERLAAENLSPCDDEGRARVMIGATDARWMGIPLREFTICVFCRPHNGDRQEGVFLAQAFNSVRWFAWVERNLFSTPYEHAAIDVDTGPRPAMQLRLSYESPITARMGMDDRREPVKLVSHEWAGPVYLPRRGHGVRKYFLAKIAGETRTYAFDEGRDVLTLQPFAQQPVIQWLVESRFMGREWAVRESARHGKSKTLRRQ